MSAIPARSRQMLRVYAPSLASHFWLSIRYIPPEETRPNPRPREQLEPLGVALASASATDCMNYVGSQARVQLIRSQTNRPAIEVHPADRALFRDPPPRTKTS